MLAAEQHADHRLGIGQMVDLGGAHEDRVVDGGDAVLGRAAGHDLVELDRKPLEKSVSPHSYSQCEGASRASDGGSESAATSARAGTVNAEIARIRIGSSSVL